MKYLLRRAGATCLVAGSMLFTSTPSQAASATYYYPVIKSPKDFSCVSWQYLGDYRYAEVSSVDLHGRANQAVRVGDPTREDGIMAMPGERMAFLVTDGTAFPGEPCNGRTLADANAATPTQGNTMTVTLAPW